MPLKIAVTGAHGTGKDTLVKHIGHLVRVELGVAPSSIKTLGSATRHVMDVTGQTGNEDTTDWTQLWSAVQRRLWEYEAVYAGHPVIISPRTGLDEVCYEGVWLAKQRREIERDLATAPKIIVPTGDAVSMAEQARAAMAQPMTDPGVPQIAITEEMQARMVLANRSELVFHLLLEQASYEAVEWWDVIYWKRPLPDMPVEADGVRSIDPDFQRMVDQQEEAVIRTSPIAPLLAPKLIELPREVDEARAFLDGQVGTWRTILEKDVAPA